MLELSSWPVDPVESQTEKPLAGCLVTLLKSFVNKFSM